jgi:RNA recognition motif-containing protein
MRQDKFRGNVFVANLPNGTTDEELAAMFDAYGLVIAAFLARDPTTRETKGFGLVNIAPERGAREAIAALNGTKVGGRCIEVRPAEPDMFIRLPRPPRPSRSAPPTRRAGFVVERIQRRPASPMR